ncbi:hypothetical protein BR93DRAFT_386127 [Coniochaeta sp. PMI_546]|nr:hypothetical protein BR93DRAFT_386127 [Coniochaeta sp. PMI_546]
MLRSRSQDIAVCVFARRMVVPSLTTFAIPSYTDVTDVETQNRRSFRSKIRRDIEAWADFQTLTRHWVEATTGSDGGRGCGTFPGVVLWFLQSNRERHVPIRSSPSGSGSVTPATFDVFGDIKCLESLGVLDKPPVRGGTCRPRQNVWLFSYKRWVDAIAC